MVFADSSFSTNAECYDLEELIRCVFVLPLFTFLLETMMISTSFIAVVW